MLAAIDFEEGTAVLKAMVGLAGGLFSGQFFLLM